MIIKWLHAKLNNISFIVCKKKIIEFIFILLYCILEKHGYVTHTTYTNQIRRSEIEAPLTLTYLLPNPFFFLYSLVLTILHGDHLCCRLFFSQSNALTYLKNICGLLFTWEGVDVTIRLHKRRWWASIKRFSLSFFFCKRLCTVMLSLATWSSFCFGWGLIYCWAV